MDALKLISESSMRKEIPAFSIGDTVRVHVKIVEGEKSRIQVFVDKVEVVRKGKVRRAKLYYLRNRVGKAAKVKESI